MKKFIAAFMLLLLLLPAVHARVDARFIIKDENGRQIYMKTPDGKIIFGNVVVGQEITFDASNSISPFKIDIFRWDFDGDGETDKVIKRCPFVHYIYTKPGIYNVTLYATASAVQDGDSVTHTVVVVEKLIPPYPQVNISLYSKNDSIEAIFNASSSYDEDGYIKSCRWDFDGDGTWDKQGLWSRNKEATWNYTKNGYYKVTLELFDYDLVKNSTIRIIKINNLQGKINETEKNITFKNEIGKEVKVKAIVNNNEIYELTIENESEMNIKINPDGINEINVLAEGKSKRFLFNATDDLTICIGNEIYLEKENNNKSPGFGIILFAFAIMIILMRKFRAR